jgi:hypothetical protein
MGNYCTCLEHTSETPYTEIEEIKREKLKFDADIIDQEVFSSVSICINHYSPIKADNITIKSVCRSYLIKKYLIAVKIFNSFTVPHLVLYDAPPTSYQIQIIEKSIEDFFFHKTRPEFLSFPAVELPQGGYYQGQWDIGLEKPSGFGIMLHKDCSKYIGSFDSGKKSGKGRLIKTNGEVYEGDFFNDTMEGHGILKKKSGNVYKGTFRNGKRHGDGIIEYQGVIIFKGQFFGGLKNGKGHLTKPNGDVYIGEFANNKMEGFGSYSWKDGKTFVGSWKANKMHGEGLYKWSDGREYKGSYLMGNRDGYGIFKWPDGREYTGEWSNGTMNGLGTYKFTDETGKKTTIKAIWASGKKIKTIE